MRELIQATIASEFQLLPLKIEQSAPRGSRLFLGAALFLIVMALASPFLLIVETLVYDPAVRAALIDRPVAATLATLGAVTLAIIFGWPLFNIVETFTRVRSVQIDQTVVAAQDRQFFRETSWQEPLSAYAGVSRRARSNLSGGYHELVLIHPDKNRSVLLAVGDRIDDPDVVRVAALLKVDVISAVGGALQGGQHGVYGPAMPQWRVSVACAA